MILLPPPLLDIVAHLRDAGYRPVFVGGFVRDAFTGKTTSDVDIELYGADSLDALETSLSGFGPVNTVGKSFGVCKLTYQGYTVDLSLPRLDSKHGNGHKGFDVICFKDLDYAQAARRRDFTINAIGYDPFENKLLDPYGGIDDLKRRILRCVDPETFVEDPLRVLRAVQFAARFNLQCDPGLLELCTSMIDRGAFEELPKERIFDEFKKLFLLSPSPSIGLKLLQKMGGLPFFSPLEKLAATPQNPHSHPEGDVWTHVLMCVDVMASAPIDDPKRKLYLMLAVLLHDIAKPFTTVIENGKITAPGHALAGVDIARAWLGRICEDRSLVELVLPLVRYHGFPKKLYEDNGSDSDILHLSRVVRIDDLIHVARADFFGRMFAFNVPERFEAGEWLYANAKRLNVLIKAPDPLLKGRDLIALGMQPSTRFSQILSDAYNAQLDLNFTTHEEVLLWVKNYLANPR
ncbi:MAG: CCA tRNA nucleotidyltransferase [Sulfuricurvum sp.]